MTPPEGTAPSARTVAGSGGELPELPAAGEVSAELLAELRRFHWGVAPPGEETVEGLLPALLHPFRDGSRLRADYPLFVAPPAAGGEEPVVVACGAALEDALPPDAERVVADNLPRLEREVRRLAADRRGPIPARELVEEAASAALAQLALAPAVAETLAAGFAALAAALPEGGRFLPFDEAAAFHLLAVAVRARLAAARRAFGARVEELLTGLTTLLEVDRRKRPEGRGGDALAGSLGELGGRFLRAGALAEQLGGHRGAAALSDARRQAIEETLRRLATWPELAAGPELVLVHDGDLATAGELAADGWEVVEESGAGPAAGRIFDGHAGRLAAVVRAAHRARLELHGSYDAERHAPWLAALDWQAFSAAELALLPRVVTVVEGRDLLGAGADALLALLLSGRPVQLVARVDPAASPGPGEAVPATSRLELGYLGLGLREVLVHQGSVARPEALARGMARAARSGRPALHVLAVPPTGDRHRGWLAAGAAVEARCHPLFLYDPAAGRSWARRLAFADNPGPEDDWPHYPLAVRRPDGGEETLELAFTAADFALLVPELAASFRPLAGGVDAPGLAAMADWLELPEEEAVETIPYVWAVDAAARLRPLAVDRRLALLCRDRRGFWQTLQELAGIHNEHVEEARRRAREEAAVELEAALERQRQEHAAAIETVRAGAAEEVVDRLTASLLGETLAGAVPAAAPPAVAPVAAAAPPAEETPPAAAAAAKPAAPAPEPAAEPIEPWIDSALCTACNDCMQLNPQMFAYNGRKKAYLKDPRAGSYRQLVEAAEACPAGVIHPGTPLDPDEPGLEELERRAARFN